MEDASPPGPTPTARRRPLTRRRGGLRAALSPANLLLAVLIIFLAWCYFGDKFILRKPIKYDEEAGYDDLDPLELHDRLNTNLGALHGAAEILLREKVDGTAFLRATDSDFLRLGVSAPDVAALGSYLSQESTRIRNQPNDIWEYWALDPDHVHLLFMLAVFAPRWLVAYLLYSAPKSGILSRCFAADAWPTALYSAGTYLVPILWLMSPHMVVFLGLFASLIRLHPWLVISYGFYALPSFRSEIHRFGEHCSGLWAQRNLTLRGFWSLFRPETWLRLLPPPRSALPHRDAIDLLKARLYHTAGYHLLPWPLLMLQFLHVVYVAPVLSFLWALAQWASPDVEERIRGAAFRLWFRSPETSRVTAPPRTPREGPGAGPPAEPSGAVLLQQAHKTVVAAGAELKRVVAEEHAAEATLDAAVEKARLAAQDEAAAVRESERLAASSREDGGGGEGGDSDVAGAGSSEAREIAVTEARGRRLVAEAKASLEYARVLRAAAAVRAAQDAEDSARAAFEAMKVSEQAALETLSEERDGAVEEAAEQEARLAAAVEACAAPLRVVEEAREAYIASVVRVALARRALQANAQARPGPPPVEGLPRSEETQPTASRGCAAPSESPRAWEKTPEGRALQRSVEDSLEAQQRLGKALKGAVVKLAERMRAVTEADARLSAITSKMGELSAGAFPPVDAAEPQQQRKLERSLRDAERERSAAQRALDKALAAVSAPLAGVAKVEAEYAAAAALASDAVARLLAARVMLPTGEVVPAGVPLLPEERKFLFVEDCIRMTLSGNIEGLVAELHNNVVNSGFEMSDERVAQWSVAVKDQSKQTQSTFWQEDWRSSMQKMASAALGGASAEVIEGWPRVLGSAVVGSAQEAALSTSVALLQRRRPPGVARTVKGAVTRFGVGVGLAALGAAAKAAFESSTPAAASAAQALGFGFILNQVGAALDSVAGGGG